MNVSQPLISVILPVYNGEKYLLEAVQSILNQTYSNFELIVVNDGSKDKSEEIIKNIKDPRIVYHYKNNSGLADSLNYGISLSKGYYIARQDQDDISYPTRFEKQVDFLEKNKNVGLLGTRARVFKDNSSEVKYHNHPTNPWDLKFDLLFDNPFVHSSVMFRKEDFLKVNNYNTDRNYYEDYELWSRFAEVGDVANLKDVLVDYRHHDMGLSKMSDYFNSDAVFSQNLKNYERMFGKLDEGFVEISALMHAKKESYKNLDIKIIYSVLDKIADKIIQMYPDNKKEIIKRANQYKSVILYRINMIKRLKYENNPFMMFFLRVQYRLFRYQNVIIND